MMSHRNTKPTTFAIWCGMASAILAAGAPLFAAGSAGMPMMHARYGGPTYTGAPALAVTASFVAAGGGPADFSTAKAITSMVGVELTNAEVAKLSKQYSKARVGRWIEIGDFAVKDALKIATAAGVSLPQPTLSGHELASTMVNAGLADNHVFYIEFMLDKALSHKIHEQVMNDIDAKFGARADADYHRISNQAFVDVAHALGAKNVRLASFH